MITTAVGNGAYGYSGDGGEAIHALLSGPVALAVDSGDNLYIADVNNNAIRKVSPAGIITTVAGTGFGGYSGDGGPAVSARLFNPRGVAVDRDGNLYVADFYNRRVRKVSPDGTITTVAGNGGAGYSGDGGPATSAQIWASAVAVDNAGDLYISGSYVIRKVSPNGLITTLAGCYTCLAGDGGPATAAGIGPAGLAIDGAGNFCFGDSVYNRIRKVSPEGIISSVAGTGSFGYFGDGGPALSAQFGDPFALAIDSAGNLFVADRYYSVVRRLQPVQ
jgi:sugar lactone lactonase YvrE